MRKYQQHEEANGRLSLPPCENSFAPLSCIHLGTYGPSDSRSDISLPSTGVAENHTVAKDLLAGFAGAEADKLVETKGEDFYDREKMKRDAQNNASNYYDRQYQGGGDSGYGGNQGGDSGYGGNQGDDSGYGGNQGGDSGYGRNQGGDSGY